MTTHKVIQRPACQRLTWTQWIQRVAKIMNTPLHDCPAWRDIYDKGFDPKEAVAERARRAAAND